jgi:hypothetical protein
MSLVRKLVLVSALASGGAFAQVSFSASVNIPVPTIRFEAPPPMVVVQPGVQVVENSNDEVFVNQGYYWTRRDNRWFRCRDDHQWRWQQVEDRHVPRGLARIPPGQYKHWHHDDRRQVQPVGFHAAQPPPEHDRGHGHDNWKHDDRHDDDHGHDHGHGHDHDH